MFTDLSMFTIIAHWIFFRMKEVSDEIKVDILVLNINFFPKNLAACEIITKKKNGRSDEP